MTRTVAALYDTRSEAELARSRVLSELRAKSPRIIGKDTAGAVDGLKINRSDAETYRERIRQGSYLLVAEVPSGAAPKRIIELLEQSTGAASHEGSAQRWGDADKGVGVELPSKIEPEEAKELAVESAADEPPAAPRIEPEVAARAAPPSPGGADAPAPVEEERIPVVEEELRIGKRQVVRGGARVRSFSRETPAEEQVQLREEVLHIHTRPSERRLTENEIEAGGLFTERTFEIAAMREEPVVTKSAVVREEVIVSKRVKERTETIRDSVRRTEVEIEALSAEKD
jgi:stress response protein YsnF